jgi:hypothetical protein
MRRDTDTLHFRVILMVFNGLSAGLFYFYERDIRKISEDIEGKADLLRTTLPKNENETAGLAAVERGEEDHGKFLSVVAVAAAALFMLLLSCKTGKGQLGVTADW